MAPADRVAVITGAPSGVGFNFATKLLQRGAYTHVILAVRNAARGEEAVARLREAAAANASASASGDAALASATAAAADVKLTAVPCDLASLRSVRAFTEAVAQATDRVDLLVLNAGLTTGALFEATKAVSEDGIEATFAVNHLAHWLIATDLLPQMRAAGQAHVVVTASIGHKGAAIPSAAAGGWRALIVPGASNCIQAYANTKLANVLLAYELQRRYGADGIIANALHPGAIRETNIWHTQRGFAKTLVDGVMFPVSRLLGWTQTVDQGGDALLIASNADVGGKYLEVDRWKPSSRESYDTALASELWDLSAELVAAKLGPAQVATPAPASSARPS